MNVKSICDFIKNTNLNNMELESLVQAVKFSRARLAQQNKFILKTGDSVKFTSPRSGQTYHGTVDKIKIKYVLVKTAQGRYNVPANLLEAV